MLESFRVYLDRDGYYRRFRPWRFHPRYVGYPVYTGPIVYNTEPTQSYTDCVYIAGKCPDKFNKEYGDSFEPEYCRRVEVQQFAQSLPKDCQPSNEGFNCGTLQRGPWITGVL